jgi:alpha-L-rhamnosidase
MSMTHEPDQGPDLPRSLPGQWPRRRFLGAAGLVGASALVGPFGNPVRASAQELIPDATDPHADGLSATGLTVEHLIDPLGIDRPDPLLGWNLTASRAGAAQSAYQIKVSKRPDGGDVVWSSGRVHSAQSFDIAYAGTRLTSRTRYYWQVRV